MEEIREAIERAKASVSISVEQREARLGELTPTLALRQQLMRPFKSSNSMLAICNPTESSRTTI